MPGPLRILIVGGGIAGLTLAAALHQRRFDVHLVERDTIWRPVGGGIAVQPNGIRVLHSLGLGDAVERAGATLRRWMFRDRHGELLCSVDLEALWGEVGPFIGVGRVGLHEALLAGTAGLVPCRLGTWVASLRQEDHGVSVGFGDGTRSEYDLVVGADGISSAVRQLAALGTPPVYGGQMVWRSLAPFRSPEPDGGSLQFWLGDGLFFGLCPAGNGLTYGFANATVPRFHDPVEGRLERLRVRFAGFGGQIRDYLATLHADAQIHCGPIEWLEPDRWHVGRVVLIGDAAHASSPMMGQGGCMAMEDALVLAETLHASADVEGALDLFAVRRKPRVEWVQRESRAVGEMLRIPPERRDAVLRERGERAFWDRFRPLAAWP